MASRGGSATPPDMTPMIDVMMVILVFFMAATSVAGVEWFYRAPLELTRPEPQARAERASEERSGFELPDVALTLSIGSGADGGAVASIAPGGGDDLDVALDELNRLASRSPSLRVRIAPSDSAPWWAVVRAHESAAPLGLDRVTLVASPRPNPPPND